MEPFGQLLLRHAFFLASFCNDSSCSEIVHMGMTPFAPDSKNIAYPGKFHNQRFVEPLTPQLLGMFRHSHRGAAREPISRIGMEAPANIRRRLAML